MKTILLILLSFLSISASGQTTYNFEISELYSCVLLVTDASNDDLDHSFRLDELRWTDKLVPGTGFKGGLYFWDDSRSFTWMSTEPTPSQKEAQVVALLIQIKSWRKECEQ